MSSRSEFGWLRKKRCLKWWRKSWMGGWRRWKLRKKANWKCNSGLDSSMMKYQKKRIEQGKERKGSNRSMKILKPSKRWFRRKREGSNKKGCKNLPWKKKFAKASKNRRRKSIDNKFKSILKPWRRKNRKESNLAKNLKPFCNNSKKASLSTWWWNSNIKRKFNYLFLRKAAAN